MTERTLLQGSPSSGPQRLLWNWESARFGSSARACHVDPKPSTSGAVTTHRAAVRTRVDAPVLESRRGFEADPSESSTVANLIPQWSFRRPIPSVEVRTRPQCHSQDPDPASGRTQTRTDAGPHSRSAMAARLGPHPPATLCPSSGNVPLIRHAQGAAKANADPPNGIAFGPVRPTRQELTTSDAGMCLSWRSRSKSY